MLSGSRGNDSPIEMPKAVRHILPTQLTECPLLVLPTKKLTEAPTAGQKMSVFEGDMS